MRSRRFAERDREKFFFFVIQESGHSRLRQGACEVELATGEATLLDSTQAFEIEYLSATRHLSLHLPAALLRQRCLGAVRIGSHIANSGYAAALFALIQCAREHSARIDGSAADLATRQLLDGIALLVSDAKDAPATVRTERFSKVQEIIRRNLSDETLSIQDVARLTYMSVRQLQRLFASAGTTYRDWLRAERLERCYLELRDRPDQSVMDVGMRWGFDDPSYFSRTFRNHFGICARDVRRMRSVSETSKATLRD